MTVLVTGGGGFIGRWVVKALLDEGKGVVVLDDFSNGSSANLDGLSGELDVVEGSIADAKAVDQAFASRPELCLHLAAAINVQNSIDDPVATFRPDVLGTLLVLEGTRERGTPFVFMSSCMVYAPAHGAAIAEDHALRPASPYAASKLAGESLTLSYGHAYGQPVTVVRPFNTYGPHQRADGEGGVVAIFCERALREEPIEIFGDGTQTRDLLYVEDCAEFLLRAAMEPKARGELLNAGTGQDVAVNELAELVGGAGVGTRHVTHPHPQAEIARLVCDSSKAERILGWHAEVPLAEGVRRTREWIGQQIRVTP
jgi:nucleoside-diphosphate-sugar epimerase